MKLLKEILALAVAASSITAFAAPATKTITPKPPVKAPIKGGTDTGNGGKATPPVVVSEAGTDTGNGGISGSRDLNLRHYDRTDFPVWCNAVQGWLKDVQKMVQNTNNLHESRQFLIESIQGILSAYNQGGLPMQPLTYSLLGRAVAIDRSFPQASAGTEYDIADQVSVIVLQHMIDLAIRVNAKFDMPKLLPYYDRMNQCRHDCHYDLSVMYLDYIENARAVLEEFYAPAIPELPARGNLLEAMAYDRWELEALNQILGWIASDISRDVFRRGFECVESELGQVQKRLNKYLDGTKTRPFNDRSMRYYIEQSLADALEVFKNYSYHDGRGYCGAR